MAFHSKDKTDKRNKKTNKHENYTKVNKASATATTTANGIIWTSNVIHSFRLFIHIFMEIFCVWRRGNKPYRGSRKQWNDDIDLCVYCMCTTRTASTFPLARI